MNVLSDCRAQLSMEYLVSIAISVTLAMVAAVIAWVIVDMASAVESKLLQLREDILTTVLK